MNSFLFNVQICECADVRMIFIWRFDASYLHIKNPYIVLHSHIKNTKSLERHLNINNTRI